MKKRIISALVLSILLTSSVSAFAIDSRISDSGHSTYISSYGGIQARGYTTSTTNHYTSARLYCSNGQVLTSDREWGTGTVFASTDYLYYDSDYNYGSAVYYGF